jgi:hypothetical protein
MRRIRIIYTLFESIIQGYPTHLIRLSSTEVSYIEKSLVPTLVALLVAVFLVVLRCDGGFLCSE